MNIYIKGPQISAKAPILKGNLILPKSLIYLKSMIKGEISNIVLPFKLIFLEYDLKAKLPNSKRKLN